MGTIRYGIGELYGADFSRLTCQRIRELASASFKTQPCPFKSPAGMCSKKGGVCSLRLYQEEEGKVTPATHELITTCPTRFYQNDTVLAWVGRELLAAEQPLVVKELPFLMADAGAERKPRAVGKIDLVLVHPEIDDLRWCALEIQAVYFSGLGMADEFRQMRTWQGPGIPFPIHQRRPDFRSSGPKRLMPQLQIKVPTIARWGKKMAVVIDKAFWESLGEMTEVNDKSSCDIAWFVVEYENTSTGFVLKPGSPHLTTLDRAIEGLTGGMPTSLEAFEASLRARIKT